MNLIKSFQQKYNTLPIIKKFLLAPLIGLVLVVPFYIFVFFTMVAMKQSVNNINLVCLPLYQSANANILLLEKILGNMNNAVVAKEIDWIKNCDLHANQIRKNLATYKNSLYFSQIEAARLAFDSYYISAELVTTRMIQDGTNYDGADKDTQDLIVKYKKIESLFEELKETIQAKIEKDTKILYTDTNFILINGNFIFFVWFGFSSLLIFLVYRDLKRKLYIIVKDAKEIADGDVDFKRRLSSVISHDEFGQIIGSINLFIDKLQEIHTNLADAKQELDSLYITDRLTNVYNRIKIDELITFELKKKQRNLEYSFSIILLDIDHFKSINDTYGHIAGDGILKEFASIIKKNIREIDLVARWGGEEFMIVCIETDAIGALNLAEKLRQRIKEFNFTKTGRLSASFGIAESLQNDSIDSLTIRADKALYEAKNLGRDRVVVAKDNL